MGTQISWLLPAALVAHRRAGLADARRARAPIALRASVIVWGGWLLVTGIVLSFASGIIHPYYTVALAPAIAALVGIGVVDAVARARATRSRAGCSPASSRPARGGRSSCSDAPTGTLAALGGRCSRAPWRSARGHVPPGACAGPPGRGAR